MSRESGLTVSFTNVGKGQVVLDLPPDALMPEMNNQRVPGRVYVDSPDTPSATNVRLDNGMAQTRPGYEQYADLYGGPTAGEPVIGMYNAVFDDGTQAIVMGTTEDLTKNTGGAWGSINAGSDFTKATAEPWTFTLARRSGVLTPRNQMLACNGVDDIVSWAGTSNITRDVGATVITGARVLLGHQGRGFAMNVIDTDSGDRREQRVQYSILGDSSTWTGTGSGFVDLDDDPYPIVAATVVAGRIVVYKGNAHGGSVVVGTPTGSYNTPYRWDTVNKGTGVGILFPRTLVHLSENLTFFLGHDGFYIHDGARGLTRLPSRMEEDLLGRVNYGSLKGGVAWLKPRLGEVVIGVPIGEGTWASEYWTFNIRERRFYGPYAYDHQFTAATIGDPEGTALTWNNALGSWDNVPTYYPTWNDVNPPAGASGILLGADNGETMADTDAAQDDNGAVLTGTWYTPAIVPKGYTIYRGDATALGVRPQHVLDEHDVLTLRDVTIRYRDGVAWTPVVEVSIDGGSAWTTVSDGVAVGGGGTSKLNIKSAYLDPLSSNWFQLRVSGSEHMKLSGMTMSFTYAGDKRNE